MATVRVPVVALASGEHSLGPRVAHYLTVHRMHVGDTFRAFDPDRALEGDAEIRAFTATDVAVHVGDLRPARLVATREVTWIQALPKGEKMDSIVRDATELGATRIVPVTTSFTVVKLEGPRKLARTQRWQRIATEAARQCGRSDVPEIGPIGEWDDVVADTTREGAAFCLYEKATLPLGPLLLQAAPSTPLTFAAGPEGGLSKDEVALAETRGFAVVSLGPFVLRAETVAAAVLGAVGVMAP